MHVSQSLPNNGFRQRIIALASPELPVGRLARQCGQSIQCFTYETILLIHQTFIPPFTPFKSDNDYKKITVWKVMCKFFLTSQDASVRRCWAFSLKKQGIVEAQIITIKQLNEAIRLYNLRVWILVFNWFVPHNYRQCLLREIRSSPVSYKLKLCLCFEYHRHIVVK